MRMHKKLLIAGLASAIALGALAAPAAQAADKNIIIWTDGVRGKEIKGLLKAIKPGIPGYKYTVKVYPSLTDLDTAFANATRATGPDVIFSNAAYASKGAEDGKLLPIRLPAAIKGQFTQTTLNMLSYDGTLFGVPLDFDTTALWYNKNLVAKAPKTFGEMVDTYKKLKSTKGLTAGFCAGDSVWAAQPLFTALGGGAWAYSPNGTPIFSKTLFNSAAFKANVTKYLAANKDFYKWDNCTQDFLAGKIPYIQKGPWGSSDIIAALGNKYGITAFPGLKAGTFGNPWGGAQGAYVTVFSASHGVQTGAMQFATKYMSSAKVQLWLAKGVNKRIPANQTAAKQVTDPIVKGVAASGAYAIPQLSIYLDNKKSGAGWYDTVNAAFQAILQDGANVGTTLDAAAAKILANFADAGK